MRKSSFDVVHLHTPERRWTETGLDWTGLVQSKKDILKRLRTYKKKEKNKEGVLLFFLFLGAQLWKYTGTHTCTR